MLSKMALEIEFNSFGNETLSLPLIANLTPARDSNDTYPEHLRFTETTLTVVLVYGALFIVAAIGNLTVFISLFRSRHRKSRINLMISHLALADLLVTFIMIPLEIGWRITMQWIAGNLACKAFLFLRAFGLYLSSNVLVCVSLDRYFAVLHPLKVNDARRRGKTMLAFAWGVSLLYSIPQSVVFHVSAHPKYHNFYQCVTYGFFTSMTQEIIYNLLCLIAMYFIPLSVIIVTYSAIMCEISKKSKETKDISSQKSSTSGRMRLRRSDISNIERARSRTLRMTITIVLVFVWCWTPYVVMTLWYMFDRDSATKLPSWLQDTLFMMAVSNSCMNPVVYGSYVINFRKECSKCLHCFAVKTTPALARKSTDAVMLAVSSGGVEQPGLARRLIKYILELRKGSLATKSTILQGAIEKPMASRTDPTPKKRSLPHLIGRTVSIDIMAHLSEPQPPPTTSHRNSFHSDPYPCTTTPSPPSQRRIFYSTCSHQEHLYGTCCCIAENVPFMQWRSDFLETKI